MISIWHLLWIVPGTSFLSMILMALITVNKNSGVCEDCPKTNAHEENE